MTTMVPVMISVSNDSHREILFALNDALAKHETVQFGDRRFVPVYSREDGWTYNETQCAEGLPGEWSRGEFDRRPRVYESIRGTE